MIRARRALSLAATVVWALAASCSSSSKTAPSGDAGTSGTAGGDAATADGQADVVEDAAPPPDDGAAGTGAAGTGAAGTGAAGTGPPPIDHAVLTRNRRETRDGLFVQPTLTRAMAAKMAPDEGFKATFTGNMWASPLYAPDGPGGKGVFIAVTTNNYVYALDELTGAVVWTRLIGPAAMVSGSGCADIQPIGIVSTPVIDGPKRTLYVATSVGGSIVMRHEVHALSLDDGTERPGWPVDAATAVGATGYVFTAWAQNQRSALSLVNGVLYVAYGGHKGDCPPYHGVVLAIDTSAPTKTGAWTTGGLREGIWAAGGMASDGDGVIATTGNRRDDGSPHQDSEEVVRVTGMGTVNRTTGLFFPASWRAMDLQDADFGANNPVIFPMPGSTPSAIVAALAKDGHLYLLDPKNLGGSTPLQDLVVATGGPARVISAPAAFPSAGGVRVVFNTLGGAACATGTGNIMSVLVSGATPKAAPGWCALGGTASPIATSTNGKDETVVWFFNGALQGVDGDTGEPIYSGGTCAGVRRWSSPIAVKGRIVVGGDGNLCSWSPH
jgi:hypothetical protein